MTGKRACIFGASGGVGRAMVEQLAHSGDCDRIFACSRSPATMDVQGPIASLRFDLTDEESIMAVAGVTAVSGPLDLVIVATGVLYRADEIRPEKSWKALGAQTMANVLALNCIGPPLIAKHMLPQLAKDRRTVFAALSARVGSIEDNRLGRWHSYRASKAALNMLIRNFAIEYARRNPLGVVVALHPGTVDTGLSKPFQRNIARDTLLSADQSAGHLLKVIGDLSPDQSGRFYAWDGKAIAYRRGCRVSAL